ncbi:MAG: hypothetical protein II190_02395, partial [Ruminococcus sp.]|nr:hypothetical protein [Ruminococcus sp.]
PFIKPAAFTGGTGCSDTLTLTYGKSNVLPRRSSRLPQNNFFKRRDRVQRHAATLPVCVLLYSIANDLSRKIAGLDI